MNVSNRTPNNFVNTAPFRKWALVTAFPAWDVGWDLVSRFQRIEHGMKKGNFTVGRPASCRPNQGLRTTSLRMSCALIRCKEIVLYFWGMLSKTHSPSLIIRKTFDHSKLRHILQKCLTSKLPQLSHTKNV